ncbi:MAG TPA: hypothetical protein VG389_21455 [Myxococcota bacterium]|jgi:hypothetical protein|nr:hypothetical protein [Myxococcota bacterium]
MASARIRFRFDVATGKQELVIEYESEGDALPREHEAAHRALVEELRRRGVLHGGADDVAVVLERVAPAADGGGHTTRVTPGGEPEREPA